MKPGRSGQQTFDWSNESPPASGDSDALKRTNDAGVQFGSSRDFAAVLGYGDYRNFEGVLEKAKLACFNSGRPIVDHFVDVTDMIEIGKGGQRLTGGPGSLNLGA